MTNGKIAHLYLKVNHGQPMKEVREATADSGKGLVGDASYGRRKRQVLLIEKETLDEFGLVPGQIKENLTVKGISLAGLPAGSRLKAGDILFEVTGDCHPCHMIEDIQPGLEKAMTGRRGTLCRVVEGGSIKVEDAVFLV